MPMTSMLLLNDYKKFKINHQREMVATKDWVLNQVINTCWITKVPRICNLVELAPKKICKPKISINSIKIVCIACNNRQYNHKSNGYQEPTSLTHLTEEIMMDQIRIQEHILRPTVRRNIKPIHRSRLTSNVLMLRE